MLAKYRQQIVASNVDENMMRPKVFGASDHQQMALKGGVVTRSRAALGDIKNVGKIPTLHGKEQIGKPSMKENVPLKKDESQDVSMAVIEQPMACLESESSPADAAKRFREKWAHLCQQLVDRFGRDTFDELDRADQDDPMMVTEYVNYIFAYMQERELVVQPLRAQFMPTNCDLTPRMRYILIDWLAQVHINYKLLPETIYLTVALLDRYLQETRNLTRDRLQLIGVTALFIASKFEEMYPPHITDFATLTDTTYSARDLCRCEREFLHAVGFYVSMPLPIAFLRRYSRVAGSDFLEHNLAKYLLELTIMEYDLTAFACSVRAGAALCLSLAILRSKSADLSLAWSNQLQFYSGLTVDDLDDYVRALARAANRQYTASKFRTIFKKYATDAKLGNVSTLPEVKTSLNAFLSAWGDGWKFAVDESKVMGL